MAKLTFSIGKSDKTAIGVPLSRLMPRDVRRDSGLRVLLRCALMHFKTGLALAISALLLAPNTAAARIVCDGNYQIIHGQPHATPYCQDENLAKVARSYGMRVSGDAMRHSPSAKGRVCRFIGHDIRVREACQNYQDERPSIRPF
jgi:hypothetical protein